MGSEVRRQLQQVVAYLRTVVGSDDPLLRALLKRIADESTGSAAAAEPNMVKKVMRTRLKGRLPDGLKAQ